MPSADVLAIFAHRDDAELACGGTLAKLARAGRRTAILDLTQGELGTRGTAELREAEASRAASVLGVLSRENLALPDAGVSNTSETRRMVARVIRTLRPHVVIAPAQSGRHPDHRVTAELVRDACFIAGLAKVDTSQPAHRPLKILHAIAHREDALKPTFVVDISADFETKLTAIKCYASQFDGVMGGGEVFPNGEPLYELVRHQAAHYGSMIRCKYGEPFHTTETMRVDDVMALEVATL
ncbi:MAG TPA: bacillithiol biosynthesis deacetylase BshB1 [Gemmatimonadaceae bacterium]|nr:bacillithiol biosynthesis deacetylase BshB1 [Gemmatimonadaceae bacterium]